MSKGTSIKEAIALWEARTEKESIKATEVGLQFQFPPIEKMDAQLNTLQECRKLSLSSNRIEKITGINTLKNLRILSLARNCIKSLSGIEALGETLEELWVSYNSIEKLKQLEAMKALKVFYVTYNNVKEWVEFNRMALPKLEEISFIGNPLVEGIEEKAYRDEAIKRLQNLKKLDGEPVIRGL